MASYQPICAHKEHGAKMKAAGTSRNIHPPRGRGLHPECADDSSVGSVAWANPTNAQGACDTVVSTTGTLVPGALSHYLKATNLGFSLPSNVPILGITVVIRKSASSSTNVTDGHVRIVKGGSVSGDDKPSGTEWANSLTDSTYGSGSDLWGLSWTPSDINDSSFGVVIAAFNNGITGSRTASVDCFTVTVTYPSLNPYQRLWYSPSTSSASSTWNHLTEASGTRDNSWDGSLITAAYYWFMWQWDNVDPGPSYVRVRRTQASIRRKHTAHWIRLGVAAHYRLRTGLGILPTSSLLLLGAK